MSRKMIYKNILCTLLALIMVLTSMDYTVLAANIYDSVDMTKIENTVEMFDENVVEGKIGSDETDLNGNDYGTDNDNANSTEDNSGTEDDNLESVGYSSDTDKDKDNLELSGDSPDTDKDNSDVSGNNAGTEEENPSLQEDAVSDASNSIVADGYAGGSGTEDDPYLISDIGELNYFCQDVSENGGYRKYYKLATSITLNENLDNPENSWTPIPNFKGHFDGNNRTISNLYIHYDAVETNVYARDIGLFSYVYSYGGVSNLKVENVLVDIDVESYSGSAGLDLGIVAGESYADISNCTLMGTVTIKNSNPVQGLNIVNIGGIVGLGGGTVSQCNMEAKLQCLGDININYVNTGLGGIVGTCRGTVENCANYGQVIMESGGAAGIVCNMYNDNCILQNCRNEEGASVSSIAGNAAGIVLGGEGMISYCHNLGSVSVAEKNIVSGIASGFGGGTISECSNKGTLSGPSSISGIVGNVHSSNVDTLIIKCKNEAAITADETDSYVKYVSGIVGHISLGRNDSSVVRVTECVNSGNLTGTDIGGIVYDAANIVGEIYIEDCRNEGKLVGEKASGIAGSLNGLPSYQGAIRVTDCHNQGEITASKSGQWSGGIAGNVNYAVIENCYNSGRLYSDGLIGGIAGKLGFYGDTENTQIKSCFNLGEIVSGKTSAGIVADMSGGTISACYNMGKLVSVNGYEYSDIYIGGIVGNAYISAAYNDGLGVIENCFNCGSIQVNNDSHDGNNDAGGIIGYLGIGDSAAMTINSCYNVGRITAPERTGVYAGAVAGYINTADSGNIQSDRIYYLQDSLSAEGFWYNNKLTGTNPCSEEQMKQTSTYEGWDFTQIWKQGNRKYVFPMLQGVGEEYLVYDYAGIGQDTVFGEYILQAVDKGSGAGLDGAVFTYRDKSVTADENGMIRVLTSDPALGEVLVTRNHYFDVKQNVALKSGSIIILELERKKDINFSSFSVGGVPHMEGGETTVNGDTSNALDIDFPIKIDFKYNAYEDKTQGSEGTSHKAAIPVKVSWEGDTRVKLSIGLESVNTTRDDYAYVKSKVDRFNKLRTDEVLKEMRKMNLNKYYSKFGVDTVKVYMVGYIMLDVSSGDFQLVESSAAIGIEGSGSITYRPTWAGTVAYGKFTLNPKIQGSLTATLDEELGYFEYTAELGMSVKVTVAVGIGYDFLKGEAGASGTLSGNIKLKKGFNMYDDLEASLNVIPYSMLKVGVFEISTNYDGWNKQLWPAKGGGKQLLMQAAAEPSYNISDRNYLSNVSNDRRELNFTASSGMKNGSAALTSLNIDSVYPDGEPQICTMSDGTRIAVWIADDGTKKSADRTTLYYAVIKDDVIISSGPVCETGRGDYSPKLLAKGNSVYLVWMNADKEYGDSTTLEEFSRNMSLYLSVFDGTTFAAPVKLTSDNNHLPMMADLCSDGTGVTVTWVENSADNAFLAEGSNNIYSRRYEAELGDIQTLASNVPYIYSIDSGYVKDTYSVVWSQDTDGDLTTGADAELYLKQEGNAVKLTDNSAEDINVRFLRDELYWSSDGIIMRMSGLDISRSENLGIVCENAFNVLQGDKGKAVIWMESGDGFTNAPMVSYEKGGAFTNPVMLEGFDNINISGYSAAYENDGSISMLYDVKEVYSEWEETPYGPTNMRYTEKLIPSDIQVEDYLYYDTMLTEVGKTLTFSTDVVNNTGSQIDTLHLELKAAGQILKEEDRNVELAAGDTTAVSIDYTLPQDFAVGVYTLTITGDGVEENNLTNNHASAQVGYANLCLKDCSIVKNEDDGTASVSGTIVNNGYQAASGETLYVRAGGQSDEIIGQIDNIALAVSEDRNFTLPIDKKYTDFSRAYDVKYFYLSLEGEAMESDYSDNAEALLLKPVLAQSVELEGDFQIPAGSSRKLNVSTLPEEAYAKCLFTSSDLSVAAVDTEGVITAYGAGTTLITAITEDGKAFDTCSVTVTDVEGGGENVIEYSMSETTVSMSKGEEMILQIWSDAVQETEITPDIFAWKSSDESVVGVEAINMTAGVDEEGTYIAAKGKITALNEGSAVITAISDNGASAFCIVTVSMDGVKAVILEKAVYEMNKGESLQLKWESQPNGAAASDFTFTSSDETVALVDADGKVSALTQGNAKIEMVYKASDNPVVRAACIIEVTDAELAVYGVTFDTNGGSRLPGSLAYQIGGPGHVFVFPQAPSKPGYNFAGWNDKEDGTGTSYDGSETLTAGLNVIDELVLYAVWRSQTAGMWAADVPDQVYTGSKLTPEIAVYDGTRLLIKGTDYTLSYKNNIKAASSSEGNKAPAIIVKGKGNYTGSQTVNFNILPRNIESSDSIVISQLIFKADSKVHKPIPVITWNGRKLANKKDFTVEYPDEDNEDAYKALGEYKVNVKGVGNYTGEKTVSLTITENELISKASVKKIKNYSYTGEPIEPELSVKYAKTELIKGTDYEVEYENNIKVGTATVIIKGKGNYSGEKRVTFKITGFSIKKAKVEGIPRSFTYTGDSITVDSSEWGTKPSLSITINGEVMKLEEGKDYEISYNKNSTVGTASILFSGINGYSGVLKKTFKITAYNITEDAEDKITAELGNSLLFPYAKGGTKPKPVVMFGNVLLAEGKDYTLSYKNNKVVTDAENPQKIPTVTIKGKGNFKGTIPLTYTITRQNLELLTISAPDKVYKNKKNMYKSVPKVTDLDGKLLKAGTDYEKEFIYTYAKDVVLGDGTQRYKGESVGADDILEAGTQVDVAVSGKGNYQGTLKAGFRIVCEDISKAKVTVPAQIYTGEDIEPGRDVIMVRLGNVTLYDQDYEIVSYSNNVKKGKASMIIKGIGNYGGTKTVSFTIKAKGLFWW